MICLTINARNAADLQHQLKALTCHNTSTAQFADVPGHGEASQGGVHVGTLDGFHTIASLGELLAVRFALNEEDIHGAKSQIDGRSTVPDMFAEDGRNWSSTQTSPSNAWAVGVEYGSVRYWSKYREFRVRPFRRLPI